MAEILEAAMVVCFGISWPLSIVRSYKSRSTKGKSLIFLCMIEFGYVCGIAAKFAAGSLTYVLAFYLLNFVMVAVDIGLYARNRRIERRAD